MTINGYYTPIMELITKFNSLELFELISFLFKEFDKTD